MPEDQTPPVVVTCAACHGTGYKPATADLCAGCNGAGRQAIKPKS